MATIITKAEEYNKEQPRPTWLSEIEKLKARVEMLEKRIADLETGAGKNKGNGYSAGGNNNERNR